MSYIFVNYFKLKQIKEINKFNTNKVEDMKEIFSEWKELEYLHLSNFKTKNVKDMSSMFNQSNKLRYNPIISFPNKI